MEVPGWAVALTVVLFAVLVGFVFYLLRESIRKALESRGVVVDFDLLKVGKVTITIPGESPATLIPATPKDAETMDRIVKKVNQIVRVPVMAAAAKSPPVKITTDCKGTDQENESGES